MVDPQTYYIKRKSKWDSKASLILNTTEVSKSFIHTNVLFDNVYLKYIQFRTLYHRFFTNDMLKKCNVKSSHVCDFCKDESDSNFNMLIGCKTIQALWLEINNCIYDLGEVDYEFSDERKIRWHYKQDFATIIIMHVKKSTPQKWIIQFHLSTR